LVPAGRAWIIPYCVEPGTFFAVSMFIPLTLVSLGYGGELAVERGSHATTRVCRRRKNGSATITSWDGTLFLAHFVAP